MRKESEGMRNPKLSLGAMLPGAVLVGAVALWPARADDKPNNDDAALVAKIDKRVQAWQPTPEERCLDDIAWARDLRDALKLAKDNSRPVFLFTYNGCAEREHAIALQRC
jgi:hypothetical protein